MFLPSGYIVSISERSLKGQETRFAICSSFWCLILGRSGSYVWISGPDSAYKSPWIQKEVPKTMWFLFLFFKNIYLFLRERGRERDTDRERWRGRERGRHRFWSWLQALSCQHRGRCGAQTHELWDHDLSQSWKLNWLSHPGAPRQCSF